MKTKIKKHSFQKKIYLSCLALYILLLMICVFVFYYFTGKTLKQNTHDTLVSNTTMLKSDLDEMLSGADSTLKDILSDQEIALASKNILPSENNYFTENVPGSAEFQKTFRRSLLSQDMDASIGYISRYDDNLCVSPNEAGVSTIRKGLLKENTEVKQIMEDLDYYDFLPPHQDYWNAGNTVISVIRSMRDTYRQYGLLFFNVNVSVISELLSGFENMEDYTISIWDQDTSVFYSTASEKEGEKIRTAAMEYCTEASGTFSYDELILSGYEVSSLTGWVFILSVSTKSYMQSMDHLLFVVGILLFSMFLVTSVALYLISARLTNPLRQLVEQLKNLEPEEELAVGEISEDNEIVVLTTAIHSFLNQIYEQNRKLTEARSRALQAHYDTLEAQLNPHFLYNTLSVIGMTGLIQGSKDVSAMCSELAALLRYSLSYSGQSVKMAQEIENGKSYLYIMKLRYEEKLECQWETDPDLDGFYVPKLILQPLIENCFQHGFRQKGSKVDPPWIIKIRTFQDESRWYLAVSNNGIPFQKDRLEVLKQHLCEFNLSKYSCNHPKEMTFHQGFGLENTIIRLNISCDGKEYFHVSSEENWTTVTVGGPLKKRHQIRGS